MAESVSQIRKRLQGDITQTVCNEEAGSFSRLWGRDCWIADSVLKLIQCSIHEEMDRNNANDPLFKVWRYCEELREKNRLGDFSETID